MHQYPPISRGHLLIFLLLDADIKRSNVSVGKLRAMASSGTDLVEIHESPDVVEIRLNRPDKLNALTPEIVEGLHDTFARLSDQVGCGVLLTGEGRVTCAGMDTEIVSGDYEAEYPELDATLQDLYGLIERHPGPVAFAARGALVGAGTIMSLSCEFVVVGERTSIVIPEIRYGIASRRAADRLPDIVGRKAATELLLLGEEISAQRARELTLVNDVVPEDAVEERARELLETVGDYDEDAVASLISLLVEGEEHV